MSNYKDKLFQKYQKADKGLQSTFPAWLIIEHQALEAKVKGLKEKGKLLEADKLRLKLALADKILDVRIKYNPEVVRKRLQELKNLLANSKTQI